MEAVDHHSVLGVAVGATAEQIREAYQARLHELRVAMRSGNAPSAEAIDSLRKAFIVLSDTMTRPLHEAAASPTPAAASAGAVPSAAAAEPPPLATPATSQAPLAPDMPLAAATPLVALEEAREFPLRFAGNGAEFFRIWIVNVFLTIITFGFYSVWAKVRREKYLHRSMVLDGSAFEYHGTPQAILKGRVLAVVIFAALSAAQHLGPQVHGGLILLLTPLVPWFAVRAFRFRAHNTSYRGIRFAFHGTYPEAMTAIIGYGFLTGLTAGLAYPYWYAKMRLFVVNNLAYGTARVTSPASAGLVARALLLPMLGGGILFIGASVLLVVVAGGMAAAKTGAASPLAAQAAASPAHAFGPLLFLVALVSVMLLIKGMFAVRTANLLLDGASVGELEVRSAMTIKSYLGIALQNWLLTILTLGLYMPFAQMRMARYRTESLGIVAAGGLDEFVGGEQVQTSALGDEASEVFDLDIAL